MEVIVHYSEVSDENKDRILKYGVKVIPVLKKNLANNLVYLCSNVLWKIELMNNEMVYLAEKISK